MRTALTIAGSDSGGGAGIQADIKTMTANGVFATSAVTALTAQNTTGVAGIMEVTPDFLGQQLDCILTDIFPDAVKIGMVSSGGLIGMIADKLTAYHAPHIVLDPVMVATSGARLIGDDAIDALRTRLIPLAQVITPNIPEAQVLTGQEIRSPEDMERAAKQIYEACGCSVLLKGGHQLNDANDYLFTAQGGQWFEGVRIDNPNTHGTGCTLSSAIAANLAKGRTLEDSVGMAKRYLSGALSAMLDLGRGAGPMNHAFDLHSEFAEN
ncbi:MAG: bifunctional hydroxymethylpyrimidine kinase/phosphomethylpyrimidine kinase [Oscillospiraceae bacterium]|nr:bifunctional hydroxymethylpyrimidine kinase/phosphomethylpyrimidine kinase [Oscillospiraceae bacterium]